MLREADARVRDILAEYDTQKRIWQCPVVMLPLKRQGESTIAIRPVESHDGMTAQYSRLPWPVIERIATAVLRGARRRRAALRRDQQAAGDD